MKYCNISKFGIIMMDNITKKEKKKKEHIWLIFLTPIVKWADNVAKKIANDQNI